MAGVKISAVRAWEYRKVNIAQKATTVARVSIENSAVVEKATTMAREHRREQIRRNAATEICGYMTDRISLASAITAVDSETTSVRSR